MIVGATEGVKAGRRDRGFAMAALLVALAVMTLLSSSRCRRGGSWMQREREEELIFQGEQYARAVVLFQRKYGGGLPPNVDVLVEQRFLRRKYRDPMAADGEFQPAVSGRRSHNSRARSSAGLGAGRHRHRSYHPANCRLSPVCQRRVSRAAQEAPSGPARRPRRL